MDKPEQLKVEIQIKLRTNEGYNPKEIASVEVKQLLNLDTDSAKRKIINEVEDLTDTVMREVSNNAHHSQVLTDGEWKRSNTEEE